MSKKAKPEAISRKAAVKPLAGDDNPAAGNHPVEKLEVEESEELRAEIDDLKNTMLRQRADFENALKRIEKQKRDELKFSLLPLMSELLTVIDHLELALKYAPEDDPLRQGVNLALAEMKKVLKKHDLEPIESLGKEFDPALHEALSVRHDPDKENNIIVEEHAVGYRLADRVVRASRVVVNKRPESAGG